MLDVVRKDTLIASRLRRDSNINHQFMMISEIFDAETRRKNFFRFNREKYYKIYNGVVLYKGLTFLKSSNKNDLIREGYSVNRLSIEIFPG